MVRLRHLIDLINDGIDKTTGYRVQPSPNLRLRNARMDTLAQLKCNLVVDAGANLGQWALGLRKDGYKGEIISYEPSILFPKLYERTRFDSRWEARNYAVLDYQGTTTLYHASNSGLSSSTKKPKRILEHELGIDFPRSYAVSVVRLDQELVGAENIYFKLDVQGSEMQSLLGAEGIIGQISAIEFESSLIDLYEKETTHYEIANWLSNFGFRPLQIVITHWDKSLRTISLDSIFVRD